MGVGGERRVGGESFQKRLGDGLMALCVCTYGVILEYGQRRSYIDSMSERILGIDRLSQTVSPLFHMPDISPLVVHSCELSTAFLEGGHALDCTLE